MKDRKHGEGPERRGRLGGGRREVSEKRVWETGGRRACKEEGFLVGVVEGAGFEEEGGGGCGMAGGGGGRQPGRSKGK